MANAPPAPMPVFLDSPGPVAEVDLLEMFAPAEPAGPSACPVSSGPLWRADAIHRARNLAQLAMSLANVGSCPTRCWLTPKMAAEARALSRAYEELGTDHPDATLSCDKGLRDVVSRLVLLFGSERGIRALVETQPVDMPAESCRALILSCSELVINALKYGYTGDRGGHIAISLARTATGAELVVGDDGEGSADLCTAGSGSRLLDQFGEMLGARIDRESGPGGRGLVVRIAIPADHLAAASR
ncbi:sensor histidine kinase [Sphingomonas sabuli]|uniref:histidine kinase n=1 Tax=Sphingomonas sabuli TaxID=2764186 RepID=A0A7G9L2E6_9SPHN|nr:ATP-binding protein [Sphingomonas sabuli]QNM82795.1 sensor histidine kinase [Sphingomonas sabuli]